MFVFTGKELSESDFLSFGLVEEGGILTNGGALLADDSPIRHSRLFCTRWYGIDKASGVMEALDDKEFEGSLVSLLQNGEEFVKNNSKKRWRKTGEGRKEMPDYPDQAVLEALVNALIHRDFMETGSEVHIDIYDNRMEIYSPGGMYDGSIVQDLDTDNIPSKRRNPVIADVFNRMHYMERRGSGIRRIKADYYNSESYSLDVAPRFLSTNNSFFVTLYNLNYNVPVGPIGVREEEQAYRGRETGIGEEKQAYKKDETGTCEEKQAFEKKITIMGANKRTQINTMKLHEKYGKNAAFKREDIKETLHITDTPISTLVNKLMKENIIEKESRGKYRFKE